MRRFGYYIFLLLLLLGNAFAARAQERNNLIATKANLVLLIDLKSSKAALDSILHRAGISEADRLKFFRGDTSVLTHDGWTMVKHQGDIVQFNRPLKELKKNPQENPFIITTQVIKTNNRPGYLDNALYGVNNFAVASVFELPSGLTRFVLQGFPKAKRVFLSGSFNNWSTLKGLMTKTGNGWAVDIKLQPGAYEYKFIADGRWMDDPLNLKNMDDGAGNINSVYYKENYTFKLSGYPSAKRVTLVGSFNYWNPGEIDFEKQGDNWVCSVYLHEGVHLYRFAVDGKWITDPSNPEKSPDANGNVNSVLRIGEKVMFKLDGYPNARNITVAGDFNNWDSRATRLKHTPDGWKVNVILPAGNYNYKFMVDGQWLVDPANPHSSIINDVTNSFIAVNANYKFKLKGYGSAKNIRLAGSFNNWNYLGYTLAHNGDEWSINLHLKPGKYLYKFIVDGNWITDPGNSQWERNEFGTGNSVLWIEPYHNGFGSICWFVYNKPLIHLFFLHKI